MVSRGAAFADGRLFCNTLDAQTIAVDAATGKEIWSRQKGGISETIWQDYSTAPDYSRARTSPGARPDRQAPEMAAPPLGLRPLVAPPAAINRPLARCSLVCRQLAERKHLPLEALARNVALQTQFDKRDQRRLSD